MNLICDCGNKLKATDFFPEGADIEIETGGCIKAMFQLYASKKCGCQFLIMDAQHTVFNYEL